MLEMIQDITSITLFLFCFSLLAICLAIMAVQFNRALSLRLKKALELINSLHKLNETQQHKINSIEQSIASLSARQSEGLTEQAAAARHLVEVNTNQTLMAEVNKLKNEIDKLVAQIDELHQQDPAAKLYAKAHSLVASGASIEEIMDACDLPQAEVEVLVGFQKKARKS